LQDWLNEVWRLEKQRKVDCGINKATEIFDGKSGIELQQVRWPFAAIGAEGLPAEADLSPIRLLPVGMSQV
jgi:hypothetical protein